MNTAQKLSLFFVFTGCLVAPSVGCTNADETAPGDTVPGGAGGGGSGGSGGTGGTGGQGGEPPACEPPTPTLCGTECVDLTSDPAHCGRCDRECDPGQQCVSSECVGSSALNAPDDFHGFRQGTQYVLGWIDTNTDEDGYLLERQGPADDDFVLLAELAADTTTYTDSPFSAADGTRYRLSAVKAEEQSAYALCDSSQKLWTYIRIIDYDDLWGPPDSPEEELQHLKDAHLHWGLERIGSNDNLDLVLLGDAYGDAGSIWAYVKFGESEIIDVPEVDMGEVSTYEDFFDWVLEHHPGQRYAIEFWGHGAGVSYPKGALGYDKTADGDGLAPGDVAQLLDHLATGASDRIDLFYLCTCLNGMFENAYEWRDSVRYFVAGETTVGCAHQPIDSLKGHEQMGVRALAEAAVAGFEDYADMGFEVVYSAVDLSQASAMGARLDELAQALDAFISASPDQTELIKTVAGQAQSMENPWVQDYERAYLDLYDFCVELDAAVDDAAIRAACADIMEQLDASLVVKVVHTDPEAYPEAHGVSIFHPNPRHDTYFTGAQDYYQSLRFSQDTHWDDYLFKLYPY